VATNALEDRLSATNLVAVDTVRCSIKERVLASQGTRRDLRSRASRQYEEDYEQGEKDNAGLSQQTRRPLRVVRRLLNALFFK
jgi:hypothetical protein